MVANKDTKINQVMNQMQQFGGNISNNNSHIKTHQSVDNNNNKNHSKSNNTTTNGGLEAAECNLEEI